MPITLTKTTGSPTSRTVLAVIEILGLDVQLKEIDVFAGEARTPEYVAKNPLHTVPMLEDGDFILVDSHAIITYLVSKYGGGKREQLYPVDVQKRALIDSKLYVDACILFPRFSSEFRHILSTKARSACQKHTSSFKEAYGFLDAYLQSSPYLAGDTLTLADISCISTVTSMNCLVPIDASFSKLNEWIKRVSQEDWYKSKNAPDLASLERFIKTMLQGGV